MTAPDREWRRADGIGQLTLSKRERAIVDGIDKVLTAQADRLVPTASVLRSLTRVIAYWRQNDHDSAEKLLSIIGRHDG